MSSPIGFKGKYFTLSAIQALHTAITLNSKLSSYQSISTNLKILECDDEDPPPDLELLELELIEKTHPKPKGNCNCYYKSRSYLTLLCSKKMGTFVCPCKKTKTGTSPPFK